jgi:hypothetical protein
MARSVLRRGHRAIVTARRRLGRPKSPTVGFAVTIAVALAGPLATQTAAPTAAQTPAAAASSGPAGNPLGPGVKAPTPQAAPRRTTPLLGTPTGPLIVGNNAAFGGGPIQTYDFSTGSLVNSFVPDGATSGPSNNGRAVAVVGNKVFYTELSGGGFGPSDAIHIAPFNGGAGGSDIGTLPNPAPSVGIQDLDYANGALYALTGYPSGSLQVWKLDSTTGTVLAGPIAINSNPSADGFTVLPDGNFLINSSDASCTYAEYNSATGAPTGSPITVPGAGSCTGVATDGTSLYFQTDFDSFTQTDLNGNLIARTSVASNVVEDVSLVTSASPPMWTELNQGRTTSTGSARGNLGGRVTSLAVAAGNSRIVFAGTAGGGVWRSIDGGHMWTPLSDQEPTLAVGAVAIDPLNDNTVYVGTGDNWLGPGSLPGEGIRYTHDALDPHPHWDWLRDPTTHQIDFAGQRVMSIVIDAGARRSGPYPSNVIVGTDQGIWQSGDGGQSWSLRIGKTSTASGSASPQRSVGWVVAQPPDYARYPGRFYAAVGDPNYASRCDGGIWVTNDGGVTWSKARQFTVATRPSTPNRAMMRIGLGVGQAGTVVAAVSDCFGFLTSQGAHGKVVYHSGDGGSTWTTVSVPTDGNIENADWFSTGHSVGQGDYDNVVALDPADTSCCLAVFGGVSLAAYDFGGGQPFAIGDTWTQPGPFGPNEPIHSDYHAAVFSSDGNTLYVGTDGGVWALTAAPNPLPVPPPPPANPVNHWTADNPVNLNAGLDALQFYRGDATDLAHVVGGTQDNGVIGNLTGPWSSYTPGNDGGYVSLYGNQIFWENDSTLSGGTWDPAGQGAPNVSTSICDPSAGCLASGDPAIFTDTPNALVNDQTGQPSILYATNRLLGRVLQETSPLVQYSPALTDSSPLSDCVKLTLSPLLPPTSSDCFSAIAAHVSTETGGVALGSDLGQIWVHTGCFLINASSPACGPGHWVQHPPSIATGSIPPPTSATKIPNIPWVTGVAISFTDPNEVWATIGTSSGPRIYHTTSALSPTATWTSLDGPSLPAGLIATGIALDPGNPSVIYVSTSKGVFECLSCGGASAQGSWQPVGPGLPAVWVWSVTVSQDRSSIIAWTFGRGAWAIARAPNGGGG